MMGAISFPIKFSGPTLAVSVDESNSLFWAYTPQYVGPHHAFNVVLFARRELRWS